MGTVPSSAVLDWEICTLGDPLADVGLLWVYWTDPGSDAVLPQASPTSLEGFPGEGGADAALRRRLRA